MKNKSTTSNRIPWLLALCVATTLGEACAAEQAAPAAPQPTPQASTETAPPSAVGTAGGTGVYTSLPLSVDYSNIPALLTAPTLGAPYKMGGVYLYPYLMLGLGHNDNVLGTPTDEISSTFLQLRPRLVAEAARGGDRYTLHYAGDYGKYSDSGEDDYDAHEIFLAGDKYFTSRASLGWRVGYAKQSDARGSNDISYGDEPNSWHAPIANLLFGYGSVGAKGRIEVEAGLMHKRYDNNEFVTRTFDVDTHNLAGRFFYRLAPKTRMLFEVRHTDNNYRLSSSDQDGTETAYNIGLTWEGTAATTGIFKIGHLEKDFDSSAREDFSGMGWEGTVRWAPRTYSTFDLTTARATQDSTGIGDYLLNSSFSLGWKHQWNDRVGTNVSYALVNSDYEGVTREDDTRSIGLGVTYDMRRWLRLGASIMLTDRASNINTYDFDRNTFMLSVEGTL